MDIDFKNKVLYNLNEGKNVSMLLAKQVGDEHLDVTVSVDGKKYIYYSVPQSVYDRANVAMKHGTGFSALNMLRPYELKNKEKATPEQGEKFFSDLKKKFGG